MKHGKKNGVNNMLKIYLDNCCFNRPYDDQTQLKIELETKAKLFIQNLVALNKLNLVWSYILDYENSKNNYTQKSSAIQRWQELALEDIDETPEIIETSKKIQETGIKNADSLHLACAIYAKCDYFITVDRRVMKSVSDKISICDPVEFVRIWEELSNDE
jgi:predicted nucleic acid-binding protein